MDSSNGFKSNTSYFREADFSIFDLWAVTKPPTLHKITSLKLAAAYSTFSISDYTFYISLFLLMPSLTCLLVSCPSTAVNNKYAISCLSFSISFVCFSRIRTTVLGSLFDNNIDIA